MAKSKRTSDLPEDLTFEQHLARLEEAVTAMEAGQLGLADSLARYEHGMHHLKACLQLLESAERRVALVTGTQADGTPITQLLPDDDGTLEEKASRRSDRRSAQPRASQSSNLFMTEE